VHRAPAAKHNGLMFTVGALVLLVLAAVSLVLLRRVTRLHREATMA
jgi:CHASE3 domain sensor protein